MNKTLARMNKYMLCALALALLTGCGGKKTNATPEETDAAPVETPSANGTMEDPAWNDKGVVTWAGHTYQYALNRQADKDIPPVKDELGQTFYDNSVELNVRRDGEVFFAKRFTKEAFLDFLTPDYKENASLQGMAFDRVTNEGLRFGVTVGYPGSDESIPLTVILAADGTVSIIKGEQPDAPGA